MSKKKTSSKIIQVDLSEFKKKLSPDQIEQLLTTLNVRFKENMNRHLGLQWSEIREKILANVEKLRSLYAMETTGGEPDVVDHDKESDEFIFFDCSAESPTGRRNVCYDIEGQKAREKKGVYPAGNTLEMADAMGIEILTEDQYRELQKVGNFDTKTSSWVKTPEKIRKLGGAVFCDRRYDTVFLYHNGAQTFYSVRGFRGSLRI